MMRLPMWIRRRRKVVIDLRDAPMLDLIPVGVLFVDPEGSVSTVNQAWLELSGLRPEAAAGHGWLEVVDPSDRPHLLAQIRRCAADEGAFVTMELALARPGHPWTRWWIVRTRAVRPGVVIAVADADAEHRATEELWHRATHDPLTGLMVRTQLFELLERALAGQARHPSHLAVLYIDVDDFKTINDTQGHGVGDAVLTAVAGALVSAVRPEDGVARVGGDEFAAVCDRLDDPSDALEIARRIRSALTTATVGDGSAAAPKASIGVALAQLGDTPEALLDRADRAMYREKQAQR